MKKTASILLLTIFSFTIKGQSLPDKIIVVKNTYQNQFFSDREEEIFSSDTLIITSKRKISKLYSELIKFDTKELLLSKFGIDTNFILNNPNELLKLYDGYYENKIDWNEKQKEFIFGKLTDFRTYKSGLNDYLSQDCCYTMHNPYRYEYAILIYNKNEITNIFTSRKSIWGYHFPYVDQSNRTVYNFDVDKQLNKLFKRKLKIKEPLIGNDLLKHIVNQTIENNMQKLYELSAYSYEKETSELTTDFDIISSEEVYGRGRYIWDEPKTIKITLKNKYMLPNVYLQFLDSKYGETLYPRDSIKKDYKEIVSRIQAIPFITNYLQQDSSSRLDIYYFNNSGINKYNIDGINKNPTEWKKQDDYIESFKWYEKSNIKPSFDIDKAIQTSERNYCGCNYRFESEFIEKAIFFELTSNRNASSIWFLLPDDTILLYHVQSYHLDDATVLDMKMNSLGNSIQLPFACLRFDKNGKLMEKK
jgi:hypothetical protein